MKCKDCIEKLWPIIIDDLALKQKTEVLKHVGDCPDCKDLFDKLEKDYSSWQKSAESINNDQFFEKLKKRLTKQETVFLLSRPKSAILAVASVAIGIAMGFLFLLNAETKSSASVFHEISNDYSLQFEKDTLFPVDFFVD
jgi:predicted anti-sigma-YlaC factor YlaD